MKAAVFSLLLSGAVGYVEVVECADYDGCEGGYQYMVDGYMKQTFCTSMGRDPTYGNWFSKLAGELEEGSLLGFCQSKGFDTLDDYVYQAVPRNKDPSLVTDVKAILCNKAYSVQAYNWAVHDKISHDATSPGSVNSKEHQTWRCRDYPKETSPLLEDTARTDCCKYKNGYTSFLDDCSSLRTVKNNFSRCGVFDECQSACTDLDSRVCFNCCYPLKGGCEWNCFTPLEGKCQGTSKAPTASPVDPTDAPSKTPTESPVDPTDAPSGTPTASPVSGPPTASPSGPPTASPVVQTDAPTKTPTGSPVDNSSPGPTSFDKDIAELICTSAQGKKACKHALTKSQGKCKWKAGKKGNGGKCHLKHYEAPVNCETLKKRQCKKAKKRGQCVAGDSKGTCKGKVN